MAWALLMHLLAIPQFGLRLLVAIPSEGWRHTWKRAPLFLGLWIVFSLLNLLHIIGHLLDELCFWGYRKVRVRHPVFILGIPRSGTTYLQRLLARHDSFTTFRTWEAVLAPSISERYLYRLLGWLLQKPGRLLSRLGRRLFKTMDDIHEIALAEPEEDFLLLLPIQACLLLAFLCPGNTGFWKLAGFDANLPDTFKTRVMAYYRLCLQKQLYFHGQEKTLLSKNPSFTSMLSSLLKAFPDARIIACTRGPAEVVPSQLSSLRPTMALLGQGRLSSVSQNRVIELLHHYYALLGSFRQNSQLVFLTMNTLRHHPAQVLEQLGRFLSTPLPASLIDNSIVAINKPRNTSQACASNHRYSLAEFALTEELINARFSDVWPLPAPEAG